jgi:hypothetical protein
MTPYPFTYHTDADILEVFFNHEISTAVIHLTPDIIFHFRLEDRSPSSLIVNNYSYLAQPDESGPRSFPLQIERWPKAWHSTIQQMLISPPVNEWLTLLPAYSGATNMRVSVLSSPEFLPSAL